ncbi:hypothetical protein BDV29DRAFT_163633 [Aspergillus leporis]|jgi:NADPH:quinone reductase-like Zn-dependent oxidoreductase|uniref:Chaperonin 10-like protein n=1 Tax=Aspergillus leporis TaxID=41062 RepID=A0A5N5WI34_9EURO|nr:hypothetical protein BDV29DRAFT_163633 [Aspergillus leporis]
MKAARVTSWGSPPKSISVPDLPPPSPSQLQLKVLAAAVPRVVQLRAAGKHPSAADASLPFDPSIDGVGLDVATGDQYFISVLAAPLFAERANVDRSQLVKLNPGADAVAVATLANPVTSSWMALRCRAIGGYQGRTVLILGATSASGRCAVVVARMLGAARVIGVSRSVDTLATVEGLDERVVLQEPVVLPASIGPVHILLDYVGGSAAVGLMQVVEVEPGQNLQYISIGLLSGEEDLLLPVRLINTKPIRIMASGVGSLSNDDFKGEAPGLVDALTKIKPPLDIFAVSLADVESAWESEEAKRKRLVLVP